MTGSVPGSGGCGGWDQLERLDLGELLLDRLPWDRRGRLEELGADPRRSAQRLADPGGLLGSSRPGPGGPAAGAVRTDGDPDGGPGAGAAHAAPALAGPPARSR